MANKNYEIFTVVVIKSVQLFLTFLVWREKFKTKAQLPKENFRTCNVLPFCCIHLTSYMHKGKVKDQRYMQNKKDPRISLQLPGSWVVDKVEMVVVDIGVVVVVQSPPSKPQLALSDSLLQTPFPTNSVWGQSL